MDRASTQIAATVREQICNHVVDIPSASAATERQLQRKYLNVKKIPRRQRKLLARIATPTWFTGCRLALELGISKAPKGWDFTIRTYAIISRTSPIFRAVSDGDLSAVQHLFLENEASPFDRSPEGETILDVSPTPLPTVKLLIIFSVPRCGITSKCAASSSTKAPTQISPKISNFPKICST